jgi:hypothetical protein
MVPSSNGGANIPGGAAVDPETGWMYVASQHGYEVLALVPAQREVSGRQAVAGLGQRRTARSRRSTCPRRRRRRVPRAAKATAAAPDEAAVRPHRRLRPQPGRLKWQIPNGETPDRIRNHPALKGVDVGNTGQNAHANLLVTKTLLMYGEGRGGEPNFRALDKATGKEIGKVEMPAQTNTAPMTFMHNGPGAEETAALERTPRKSPMGSFTTRTRRPDCASTCLTIA